MKDGCTFANTGSALYNAVIGPAIFQDSLAPVPKVNGNVLDQTITVIADGPSTPSAVVTFEATATDNCDASPNVVTSHLSGFAFPIGTTMVVVTATDNMNNSGQGFLTIVVQPWPSSQPSTVPS